MGSPQCLCRALATDKGYHIGFRMLSLEFLRLPRHREPIPLLKVYPVSSSLALSFWALLAVNFRNLGAREAGMISFVLGTNCHWRGLSLTRKTSNNPKPS